MTGLLDEAGTRRIETRRFPTIGKRDRTVTGEFEVVNVEPPRANWSLDPVPEGNTQSDPPANSLPERISGQAPDVE